MPELPTCRWREAHAGALRCHSAKYLAPPNDVRAEFCATCSYADHEPATPAWQPLTLGGGNPERFAVATLYTPEIADYGRLTSEVAKTYAQQHGYRAIVATQVLDASRPAAWSKLLLIEQYLQTNPACEWILWIDADAIIVNPACRLEDLIDEQADFIVAEDVPPSRINTGVFLTRNKPATLNLLRRAYAKTQFVHHPWWEQLAVAEALLESDGTLRSKIVPRHCFNSFPGERRPDDFIVHYAGWSHAARVENLQNAILHGWTRTWNDVVTFRKPPHFWSVDLAHNVFLTGCILSKKPDRVLELGIGPGYSSRAILDALAYNRKGTLTCVDGFFDTGGHEPAHIEALRRAGAEVVVSTEEAFVKACPSESFDVLVSDADHGRSQEWLDHHLRIVKPGGFLFFHDTNNAMFPNLGEIVEKVSHLPHHHFTENSRLDESCERGLLFVMKPA